MRITVEQPAPNNTSSWFSLHPAGGVSVRMFNAMQFRVHKLSNTGSGLGETDRFA